MGTEQYLDALEEVRPGYEAYLPALMADSQVDLTVKLDSVCRYRTRVPTLGRLLVLRATGPVGHCWTLL